MEKDKVSPDSSTHITSKRKRLRKKKEEHGQPRKSKKLKVSRRNSSEVDSSSRGNSKKKKDKRKSPKTPLIDDDDGRDLEVNIKPLSSYVNNREELYRQLFTIISKKELRRMLPGILKKLDVKEIKKLCHEQLEILSDKRLRHILAGEEMVSSTSSSSSDIGDGGTKVECCWNKDSQPNDSLDQGREGGSTQPEESKKSGAEETDLNIFQEMIIAPNQQEIDELVEGNVKPGATIEDDTIENKQQMISAQEEEEAKVEEDTDANEEAELRMLEFRARALKSLVLARERQMRQKLGQPK